MARIQTRRSSYDGAGTAATAAGIGVILFWVIWLGLKIIALPILVVNVIYLVSAIQAGTTGTFDFTWLIISLAAVIVL